MPFDTDGGYISPEDVQITQEPGLLSAQQIAGEGYGRYNVRTHHVARSGWAQLPIAGPPGTGSRAVRLHAPCSSKVITWIVEALLPANVKPTLPHWDTGDPADVLLSAEVMLDAPVIQPTGDVFAWRVMGEYHYAPLAGGLSSLSSAATPTCILSAEAFGLTEANFSRDFLRVAGVSIKGPIAGLAFDKSLE